MEIERKFLVNQEEWNTIEKPTPLTIQQGYISDQKECTVRVRTKDAKAYLTIKGITKGITRSEFEYEIPAKDAQEMLQQFSDKYIDKLRYEIEYKGKIWEVDVFQGNLAPLIIAEIELNSEDESFETPQWIGAEVSHDPNYYNSNLIKNC